MEPEGVVPTAVGRQINCLSNQSGVLRDPGQEQELAEASHHRKWGLPIPENEKHPSCPLHGDSEGWAESDFGRCSFGNHLVWQ